MEQYQYCIGTCYHPISDRANWYTHCINSMISHSPSYHWNKCPPQASWLAVKDADKKFVMRVFHAFKCVISVWMFRDTESKIGTVVPWAHYGLLVVYIYIWFPIFIINMHNTINSALHVFFQYKYIRIWYTVHIGSNYSWSKWSEQSYTNFWIGKYHTSVVVIGIDTRVSNPQGFPDTVVFPRAIVRF